MSVLNKKLALYNFNPNYLFWIIAIVSLLSIFIGIYTEKTLLLALPIAILTFFFLSINFENFYWILVAFIPLSIVHDFSKSLSTDFPTEFLCIAITGFFWLDFIIKDKTYLLPIFKHKITFLIILLLFWSIVTTITAQIHLIAIKYTLAKIWYITSYFLMTYRMIKSQKDLKKLFWVLFIPLLFTTSYGFLRTALGNFNFEQTSEFSLPFYENHVLFATTMSIFLPFIFLARKWYQAGTLIRLFLNLSIILFLFAIYFSYTRACYIAIILSLIVVIIIKIRKMMLSLAFIVLIIGSSLLYVSQDYFYLKLAPDFTKTVMHPEFKDHVIATFQGKDASSMERINMWVSVFRMSEDYPWFGVGPNNFPFSYKPYSVLYFKTWVSDNPLNLSCHNYFWLMLAEQGWIGTFLFLLLVFLSYYYLQRYYFKSIEKKDKEIIITITCAFTILLVNLIFSDLIENSKNGSLFYILLGLTIRAGEWIEIKPNAHE